MLEDIVRCSNNMKLVFLTATPMYNDAHEIVWLINLMRLNDKRKTMGINDIFTQGIEPKLKTQIFFEFINGYVSYMNADNNNDYPLLMKPKDDLTYRLYKSN